MPYQPSTLPQIDRFLVGMVTNRSPVDTPFSFVGLNRVMHYDALLGGSNMEVSSLNTLIRRPGFVPFTGPTAEATVRDCFQFKDLDGNISIWFDEITALAVNETIVKANSAGAGPWSLAVQGDFLYAVNGVDSIRVMAPNLTAWVPFGLPAPMVPLAASIQSLGYYNVVTDFIYAGDAIAGTLFVTDGANQRSLSIQINPTTLAWTLSFYGNPISPNQSYTEVSTSTGSGTITDVVTVTSGFTCNVTGTTGVLTPVLTYYPNTGLSTLTFTQDYTAPLTLASLAGLINAAAANVYEAGTQMPQSAWEPLQVFIQAALVNGLVTLPGQFPSAAGVALNLFSTTRSPLGPGPQFSSGLYDVTNPTLPIRTTVGVAPRWFRYTSPEIDNTDLVSGSVTISSVGAATYTQTYNFTNQTLAEIAAALNANSGGYWNALFVQQGTAGFIQLTSYSGPTSGSAPPASPPTQDVVLVMSASTLVDNSDTNLIFNSWSFQAALDYSLLPTQGYNWSYAIRDNNSGGLSNTAPLTVIGSQLYPGRAVLNQTSATRYESQSQQVEIYRTPDGGSSLLYEQTFFAPTASGSEWDYATLLSVPDTFLNAQLVGPIDEANDPPPAGISQIVAHSGRLWGIVDNYVYFSGGPDTTNGSGNEAWPPSNYFEFPGTVNAIQPTASGLIVALGDDLHIILGVDSSSYYAKPFMAGYGISNRNAICYDGQTIYVYTSKQQLHAISPQGQKEVGFGIGDVFLDSFPAGLTSLTFHRGSSLDTALYVSNGSGLIARMDPMMMDSWSTLAAPVMGAGRVRSLETAIGVNTLLNATTTGAFARNLTVFADNGTAYPASAVIGTIKIGDPGTWKNVAAIAGLFAAVGSMPTISVLLNEINTSQVPFTRLLNPVNDPPDLNPSLSIWSKRWYLKSTLTPLTLKANLIQVQVAFPAEAFGAAIYGVFLRDTP